jgi:hypothetical protein
MSGMGSFTSTWARRLTTAHDVQGRGAVWGIYAETSSGAGTEKTAGRALSRPCAG